MEGGVFLGELEQLFPGTQSNMLYTVKLTYPDISKYHSYVVRVLQRKENQEGKKKKKSFLHFLNYCFLIYYKHRARRCYQSQKLRKGAKSSVNYRW